MTTTLFGTMDLPKARTAPDKAARGKTRDATRIMSRQDRRTKG